MRHPAYASQANPIEAHSGPLPGAGFLLLTAAVATADTVLSETGRPGAGSPRPATRRPSVADGRVVHSGGGGSTGADAIR